MVMSSVSYPVPDLLFLLLDLSDPKVMTEEHFLLVHASCILFLTDTVVFECMLLKYIPEVHTEAEYVDELSFLAAQVDQYLPVIQEG